MRRCRALVEFEARTGGPLLARTFVNGDALTVGEDTYDAVEHAHWRFEQAGNDLIWSTSPNRVNWTPLASVGVDTLPFGVDNMWLAMDASAKLEANPYYVDARFDDVNDPGNTEPWCPTSSFSDDFADGLAVGRWTPTGIGTTCSAIETSGIVEITWPGTPGLYCYYRTSTAFNFEGSSVTMHVPSVPAEAGAAVFLSVAFDVDNWIDMRHEMGPTVEEIRAIKKADANTSVFGGTGGTARFAGYNHSP